MSNQMDGRGKKTDMVWATTMNIMIIFHCCCYNITTLQQSSRTHVQVDDHSQVVENITSCEFKTYDHQQFLNILKLTIYDMMLLHYYFVDNEIYASPITFNSWVQAWKNYNKKSKQ